MNARLRTACLLVLLFIMICAPRAGACELSPVRPVINVSVTETPVKFDLSQPMEKLNNMDINTISPYPSHYHTNVGGVMSGQLAVEHRIKFEREVMGNKVCVSVTEVNIEITTSPTIFIASDYQKQACWFKEIFTHESKHVQVDREIVEKYKGRITDGMNLVLMEPSDYTSGWIERENLDFHQYNMQAGIEHGLEVLFKQMMAERNEAQQEIDSLAEYKRVSGACHSS